MKRFLPLCALTLALAGCAAQAPRCGRRLTPINRQWIPPGPITDPGRRVARAAKASRS